MSCTPDRPAGPSPEQAAHPADGAPARAASSHLSEAETLALREAQLRGILGGASEGIITVDGSQTIVMANERASEIFGYAPDSLTGLNIGALIPARFRNAHAQSLRDYGQAEGAPRRMRGRSGLFGLRADGEEFPIDAGISQAHVDGTRLYTVIVADLSGPRRTADALRTSEKLLSATFGVGGVGMVQLEVGSLRFLAVNSAFCQLCGYSEEALLSTTARQLDAPGRRPWLEPAAAGQSALPDGDAERRIRRRDGTVIWVQLSFGLVRDERGDAAVLVCAVQDVTVRRNALDALKAREARLTFLVRLNDRLRQQTAPEALGYEAACALGEFVHADRVGYLEDRGQQGFAALGRGFHRTTTNDAAYDELDDGAARLGALRAGRTVVQSSIAADPALSAEVKARHAALRIGAAVFVPLMQRGDLVAVLYVHDARARVWTPDEVALFEDVASRVRADIERTRAEAAIRATKAKHEAALASMTDAVFISDAQGRITDVNAAFASFHRFRTEAESIKPLDEYPDFIDATLPDGRMSTPTDWVVPRALQGETGANVEFGLRDRRTGERWIGSYSFAPIRDAEGHISGSVCSARDITEQRRIRSRLENSEAELRRLIAAQDSIQEQERLRIASELHDDLQQSLAAILMEVGVLRTSLPRDQPAALESVDRVERLAASVIASTRRIVMDLRPQALEALGLGAALRSLAQAFAERSGVDCEVDVRAFEDGAEARLAPVATCLYRVVQEALNNVARHAGARHAWVQLAAVGTGQVAVTVGDDGVGIDPAQIGRPGSVGLLGMRERVRAHGGTVTVRPLERGGTLVEAVVPLLPAPAEPA